MQKTMKSSEYSKKSIFRLDYPSLITDPSYFMKENFEKPSEASIFTEISYQVRKEFLDKKKRKIDVKFYIKKQIILIF